ncbi:MAG: sulfite exporter TauE/SafE family protein [Capsulimonadales bacterium]|nr:sulfite exporter TauE/SafE family protein [Capsulimonadales bacterium]
MEWIRFANGIGPEVSPVAVILVGLAVGFVAGMFGVGGGFLLTPVLMYGFGVPPAIAVGTALCQQIGTALASFLKYRMLKRGEPRIDLVMVGGSLIGVDAGGRLLRHLAGQTPLRLPSGRTIPLATAVIDGLFVVILSAIALFIFLETWRARHDPPRGDRTIPGPLATEVRLPPFIDLPNIGLSQVSVPLLAYMGFGLGFLSGVMGVGGGVLLMPVLMYGFGISARNAAGTGVLLLFLTVCLGTVQAALAGTVSLPLAMTLLVGSSVGAQLGALTTHRLPNRVLRLAFAGLVAAAAIAMLRNVLRLFL